MLKQLLCVWWKEANTHQQLPGASVFFHNHLYVFHDPRLRLPAEIQLFYGEGVHAEVDAQEYQLIWLQRYNYKTYEYIDFDQI